MSPWSMKDFLKICSICFQCCRRAYKYRLEYFIWIEVNGCSHHFFLDSEHRWRVDLLSSDEMFVLFSLFLLRVERLRYTNRFVARLSIDMSHLVVLSPFQCLCNVVIRINSLLHIPRWRFFNRVQKQRVYWIITPTYEPLFRRWFRRRDCRYCDTVSNADSSHVDQDI